MAGSLSRGGLNLAFFAVLVAPLLSGGHCAPAGCQCTNTFLPTSPELTCRSTGDPHYTTFSNDHYDFMGRGIYRLAQLTTECGCQVEVQTFLCGCGSGGYFCAPGASANAAVVMRVGSDLKFVITSDETVSVSGGGFSESLQASSTAGVVATYDGVDVERVFGIGTHGRPGWRVHIPGGGSLLVYVVPTNSFPTGIVSKTRNPSEMAALPPGGCTPVACARVVVC